MSVSADLSGLARIERDRADILEEAARRAELEIRRYVPVAEGTLRASAQIASMFRAGLITWSTPYAVEQYYVPMAHSHPGTCDHWDEAWARERLPEWLDYVGRIYEGRIG